MRTPASCFRPVHFSDSTRRPVQAPVAVANRGWLPPSKTRRSSPCSLRRKAPYTRGRVLLSAPCTSLVVLVRPPPACRARGHGQGYLSASGRARRRRARAREVTGHRTRRDRRCCHARGAHRQACVVGVMGLSKPRRPEMGAWNFHLLTADARARPGGNGHGRLCRGPERQVTRDCGHQMLGWRAVVLSPMLLRPQK